MHILVSLASVDVTICRYIEGVEWKRDRGQAVDNSADQIGNDMLPEIAVLTNTKDTRSSCMYPISFRGEQR